jgi:hypothetical protein
MGEMLVLVVQQHHTRAASRAIMKRKHKDLETQINLPNQNVYETRIKWQTTQRTAEEGKIGENRPSET